MLGCIADDLTGATDLAALIARQGFSVTLVTSDVRDTAAVSDGDVIIVALKSRTIAATDAVAQSLAALDWLQGQGASHVYFKYCSTFDSTDQGNIGPVARALADRLDARNVAFNPAFPENGRTLYQGHLFVLGRPIHESGMANHPLTPMRDPDLVRVLARQPGMDAVGLIDWKLVQGSVDAIRAARQSKPRFLITDSLSDADIATLGDAFADQPMATGGSAFGAAYAQGVLGAADARPSAGYAAPVDQAPFLIIAGSCSEATRGQIAALPDSVPHIMLDIEAVMAGTQTADAVAAEVQAYYTAGAAAVLLSSTAEPEALAVVQSRYGRERSGEAIEALLGAVAALAHAKGVDRIIVAGGETSGAVMAALGVSALYIGPEIAPGVPWTKAAGADAPFWLTLKSGNFGSPHFFAEAMALLEGNAA
jgi:3-dehydrotetronate 4-kinase